MLKIVFKGLEPSALARSYVEERVSHVLEKFPVLQDHTVTLTLEMQNSPHQAGPDLFTVTSMVNGKVFKALRLSKSSSSFYVATAELVEGLVEQLNRAKKRQTVTAKRPHMLKEPTLTKGIK